MADNSIGPGTVLGRRFRLEDLLQETAGAKFWRATDQVLARDVAVHVIGADDRRADALLGAARTSAAVTDGHILRVLDAAEEDDVVYVVSEWGSGVSLDVLLADGPLPPRRAAWLVREVAETIARSHANGVAHGRLLPENVMVTEAGAVKLIGFVVDCVLNGRPRVGPNTDTALSEHESDVVNLAALLYATLTARWPGGSGSTVTPAPTDHGRILRPRQVRAGIPRGLDAICDRVLNGGLQSGGVPLLSAHEICAALSDFIGDPAAAPAGYEATAVLDTDALRADPGSSAPSPSRSGAERPDVSPDPDATQPGQPTALHPLPSEPDVTQAGAPVFFDDDSRVGWAAARRQDEGHRDSGYRPPPPPPLVEPEPKPLFAPGPPRHGSTRRDPHPGSSSDPADGSGAWPASGHGTGSLPPVWATGREDAIDGPGWDGHDAGGRPDTGKGWLRVAAALAAIVVLVVAVVLAFNLGQSANDAAGTARGGPSTAEPSGRAQPLAINNVSDFDPQGDTNEENPELVGLAVDGDPSTAWRTMTYFNHPQLGLLKDGVGLLVDLGQEVEVSRVRLTLVGRPTSVEILVAEPGAAVPRSTEGLRRVARATDAGPDVELELQGQVSTRYLVVWLTSLPPVSGGFAGQVAEVTVLP